MRHKAGFTLSELLIALVILGVISTFVIPKILSSQANSKKKAVVKEVVAALTEANHIGRLKGEITGPNAYWSWLKGSGRINAIRVCDGNSGALGCWDTTKQGTYNNYSDNSGFVFANGARLVGFNDGCCDEGNNAWCRAAIVDWNGTDGPNVSDEDIIWLVFNYGNGMTANSGSWCYKVKPGEVAITGSNEYIWSN